MTLIEIMLAMTILVLAAMAFSKTIISASRASYTTREMALAQQAAKAVLEQMQAVDFEQAFASYDSSSANDPGGEGTAPGKYFVVRGLDVRDGDADGFVGEVLLPEGGAGQLREDVVLRTLGMPRDLSGDGAVDGGDHSGDYRILPVLVRVEWRGENGPASFELKTILASFQ